MLKNTRDTLKANGLMSHLEYAVQQFRPRDMWQCEHHLRGAEKALAKVRAAKAEYILSDDGWYYIARLAKRLHGQLYENAFFELAKRAREIGHRACIIIGERENPISDSEFAILGPVDEDGFVIEPPSAPQVMRDPFPFPRPAADAPPPASSPDIVPAWQTAAQELGIRITTNKALTHSDGTALLFPVQLPDFGRGGIVLWTGSIHDSATIDKVEQAATAAGYGYSVINPEFYSKYDRELFTSFLCRLRFTGPSERQPNWYVETFE